MTSSKIKKAYNIYKKNIKNWYKNKKDKDIFSYEKYQNMLKNILDYEEYKKTIPKEVSVCVCGYIFYDDLTEDIEFLVEKSNLIKINKIYGENC